MRSRRNRLWRLAILMALPLWPGGCAPEIDLTPQQLQQIGDRIFHNECAGRTELLIAWNSGEAFPSLGIGHFIWYPEGVQQPFEESFPKLLAFMQQRGVELPPGLTPESKAPWPDRDRFLQARGSPDVLALRAWLDTTRDTQAAFLLQRANSALEKIERAADPAVRQRIRHHFKALVATPVGAYAVIDYINFKGEGVRASERYQGRGWGLLQVLERMGSQPSTPDRFADAAAQILKRRVLLSPAERHEARWLPGWLKRIDTYRSG